MIQTTFQRYEKKYLLTPAQYQWIFQQLQSRMQVDEYGMYPICSIYFDTDDYRLIRASLEKLSNPEVRVKVIHGAVGAVSKSDVMLAQACGAIIVGFNVRPDPVARDMAETEGGDMRMYRVPNRTDRFCMKSTGFSSFGKLHRRYFSVMTASPCFRPKTRSCG